MPYNFGQSEHCDRGFETRGSYAHVLLQFTV